ncbi:hypothetical protein BC938DRAFT_482997 [Jimgerdemannia flammicorona]|uniref:Uncharacterized protein n=1 Tax=Jimgerdemannia flammicorona TaxID=994334 RepID=A0A433QCS3_9FUNG|nr:hypothetical protein BC938DRAFT_482997 [Jimgerdemannia flammicorona]
MLIAILNHRALSLGAYCHVLNAFGGKPNKLQAIHAHSVLCTISLQRRLLPCQQSICLHIFVHCFLDHILWQFDAIFLVESDRLEVVSQILLVNRVLDSADHIGRRRPEARRVRCKDFIYQRNAPVGVDAELELCVGDDDATLGGIPARLGVELDGGRGDCAGMLLSYQGRDLAGVDVFVYSRREIGA